MSRGVRAGGVGRVGRVGANPLGWLGAVIVLYLTVPVVAFFVRLVGSRHRGFATPGLWSVLWVSCLSATISLGIIALLGIPLAYALARSRGRIGSLVSAVVALPLAVPPLMGGILLIYLVGPYTTIGRLFDRRLTDSVAGIVLAQTFVAAPFLIIAARAAFAAEDPGLEEVAATLGHRRVARFLRVALPVAAGGVRAGLLLAWLRAFGEYGATVLLSYHPASLPVYTYTQFSGSGLSNTEAPTALALAAAAVAVMVARSRLPTTREPQAVMPVRVTPGQGSATPVGFDLDLTVGTFDLQAAHRASSPRLAILGPSGSGKSLTLRSLAGLLGPGAGAVWYGAERVSEVPAELRGVGYVPQGYGLLPHLDVWSQVCFGVGTNPSLAAYWLDAFRLGDLLSRRPDQLSGGQRQRVCLAQALSRHPRVVLLDEPFSAVDSPVRAELRHELRQLQRDQSLSSVLVTHDPEEAALLADEIIVLLDGRVAQTGSASELHRQPASAPVARLLGIANVVGGVVGAGGRLEAGGLALDIPVPHTPAGMVVQWCVHPEHIEISPAGAHWAEVADAADLGAATMLRLSMGDGLLIEARATDRREWRVGDRCRVDIPPDAVTVWPGASQPAEGRDAASISTRLS